jgi:hypothetical protein
MPAIIIAAMKQASTPDHVNERSTVNVMLIAQ